jgi:hypothetical protein
LYSVDEVVPVYDTVVVCELFFIAVNAVDDAANIDVTVLAAL